METKPSVDLTKYRTPELVGQLTEILSLGGAVAGVLITALILAALFAGGAYWLLRDHLSETWLISVCAWGLVGGLASGVALGIARVVNRGLKSLASVLKHLLNMVEHAATDFDNLQSGQYRPTVAELTTAMHQQVFEPCLIAVITNSMGWLGKPVIWSYKASTGRAVALLIERMQTDDSAVKQMPIQVSPETYEKTLETAAKYSGIVRATLRPAHATVSGFGFVFRYVIVLPLFSAFLTSVLVAVVPIIIIRLFV